MTPRELVAALSAAGTAGLGKQEVLDLCGSAAVARDLWTRAAGSDAAYLAPDGRLYSTGPF